MRAEGNAPTALAGESRMGADCPDENHPKPGLRRQLMVADGGSILGDMGALADRASQKSAFVTSQHEGDGT